MAIGTTVTLERPGFQGDGGTIAPASLTGKWTTVIDAGGIATADAAAITNPLTQIVTSTTHIFKKVAGTFVAARMRHAGTGTITSPIVVLFGRNSAVGASGPWQRLYNQAATPAYQVTLTLAASTDIVFAGLMCSDVNPKTHVWDCMGCDEFVFGIETAYNATTGSEASAIVEAMSF